MKLLERLNAIYHILRYRNYILITGIKEFVDYNNKEARRMKVLQRTDYKGDSDEVTCMAAVELCKATRIKELKKNSGVVVENMDFKPEIIERIKNILNPSGETAVFNWNQIKRAINDSDLNIL